MPSVRFSTNWAEMPATDGTPFSSTDTTMRGRAIMAARVFEPVDEAADAVAGGVAAGVAADDAGAHADSMISALAQRAATGTGANRLLRIDDA